MQCPLYYFRIASLDSPVIAALYACAISGELFISLGIFFLFTLKTPQKIKFILSILLFLLLLFYNSIIISQTYALHLLSSYIPDIAFLNKESYRIFITPITISLIAFLTVISITQTYAAFKISKKQKQFQRKRFLQSLLLITLGAVLLITCSGKSNYSDNIKIKGPVGDFYKEYRNTIHHPSYFFVERVILPNLEDKSWIKKAVYTSDKEFINNAEQPNIIILFPDGIPARLINGYQKLWRNTDNPLNDLTPNIDKLMNNSFVIDNYYNHTSATYPGLSGTLTSSFPFRGMNPEEIKKILSGERPALHFSSLFDILKLNGYKSYSISGNGKDVFIPQLFENIIKVDTAYSPENIKEITPEAPAFSFLTEKEIFDSVKNLLMQNPMQPAAITAYFVNTHLNFNPLKFNGIAYRDNSDLFLSALHNFDNELGKFMDWFKTSPFAQNTILVLTTDHTHYPDKQYMKLMEKNPSLSQDFQPYFTDKIPFIIYNKHNLPAYYNAEGKTSLYFAPTLLHILGHKNYRNAFLEGSIFDETLPEHEPFVYINAVSNIFCIMDNHIYEANICRQHDRFNQKIEKIKIQQKLEIKGLLFDNQYQPVMP